MNNTVKQYFSIGYWKELLLEFVHALGTKKFWKELVVMTIGITIGAAAVYYFLMPSHLIIGTISGPSERKYRTPFRERTEAPCSGQK